MNRCSSINQLPCQCLHDGQLAEVSHVLGTTAFIKFPMPVCRRLMSVPAKVSTILFLASRAELTWLVQTQSFRRKKDKERMGTAQSFQSARQGMGGTLHHISYHIDLQSEIYSTGIRFQSQNVLDTVIFRKTIWLDLAGATNSELCAMAFPRVASTSLTVRSPTPSSDFAGSDPELCMA